MSGDETARVQLGQRSVDRQARQDGRIEGEAASTEQSRARSELLGHVFKATNVAQIARVAGLFSGDPGDLCEEMLTHLFTIGHRLEPIALTLQKLSGKQPALVGSRRLKRGRQIPCARSDELHKLCRIRGRRLEQGSGPGRKRGAEEEPVDDRILVAPLEAAADLPIMPGDPTGPGGLRTGGILTLEIGGEKVRTRRKYRPYVGERHVRGGAGERRDEQVHDQRTCKCQMYEEEAPHG